MLTIKIRPELVCWITIAGQGAKRPEHRRSGTLPLRKCPTFQLQLLRRNPSSLEHVRPITSARTVVRRGVRFRLHSAVEIVPDFAPVSAGGALRVLGRPRLEEV